MAYLDHADAAVATAAQRALAIAALTAPGPLPDAHRRVLVQAVTNEDAVTAYLAAEALWQRHAAALQGVAAESISADAAKLRYCAAWGAQATAEQRTFVWRQLQHDELATLAIDAVRASAGPDDLMLSPYLSTWTDVVASLALARGDATTIRQAIEWDALDPATPAVRQALAPLIDTARQSEGKDALFAWLATNGLLDPPQAGDLMSLIRAVHYHPADRYLHDYDYYGPATGASALDVVLQWAGDTPDEAIIARASPDTIGGVVSAAVAAIRWQHEPAIAPLLTAASGQSRENEERQKMAQHIALRALAITDRSVDVAPLVEHLASFNDEDHDWQKQVLRQQIIDVIARIDPEAAAPLWASSSQTRRYVHTAEQNGSVSAADLILLWLDLPPEERPTAAWDAAMSAMAQQDDHLATLARTLANHREHGGPFEPSTAFRMPWTVVDTTPTQSPDEKVQAMLRWATSGSDEEEDDDAGEFGFAWPETMAAQMHAAGDDSAATFYLSDYARLMPYDTDAAALVAALRPLLDHENEATRIRAMRAAGVMRLSDLATDMGNKLRDESMRVRMEAAWGLGAMRGGAAVAAVEGAYRAASDFDERVELACVLRLLASDIGDADLRRAAELTATQMILQRAMALAPSGQRGRAARRTSWVAIEEEDDTTRAGNAPWRMALVKAAPGLLMPLLDRLALPAGDLDAGEALAQGVTPPLRADLSRLSVAMSGHLSLPGLHGSALPLEPLCESSTTPMAAQLCAAEAWLEPMFFVQFADQATDLTDLRHRWVQWYASHGDKPREQWWRQAIESATEELTDERWWHRARAAARLRRLSARTDAAPNLFDRPAWSAWQGEWRAWLHSPEAADSQACLRAAATAAGVMTSFADDAHLQNLIHLAGWGPPHLAEASLLQLFNWPDPDALLAAALIWQDCPNPSLRQWVRDRARQRSGVHRLRYDKADLTLRP